MRHYALCRASNTATEEVTLSVDIVPSIVGHLQQRYLTGPHRRGSVKQTYDRLRDWESYSSAPYLRTAYFTEAYRTLARFRTGSHDLAAITGRWGAIEHHSSSSHMRQLCSLCRLDRVEDEDHFLFECPVYRYLRTVEYADLFLGRCSVSLRHFMGQANQQRVASFIRDCFRTRDYVRTLSHEPLMAPTGR